MFQPVEVAARPGHRLFLRYEDGVEGELDLAPYVGKGVFALWDDPAAFADVSLGEVRWTDDVALGPDALYLQLTGRSPEDVFPALGAAADA